MRSIASSLMSIACLLFLIYAPLTLAHSSFLPKSSSTIEAETTFFGKEKRTEGLFILETPRAGALKDQVPDSQLWPYTITMVSLALLQCLYCNRIQNYLNKKEALTLKTSPWTIVLLQTFDLYIAISNATSPYASLSIYLLVVAPYLLLSIYFEISLAMKIFLVQTRKYSFTQRMRMLRASCIESLITITAICGISLTMLSELIVFVLACSLLPQAIHNYKFNKKSQTYLWSLLVLFLPKIGFTLYIGLYQGNLLDQSYSVVILSVAAALLFIQFIVLLIQSKFPRFILNPQNPYQCTKLKDAAHAETTCSICLFPLKDKPLDPQEPLLRKEQPDSGQSSLEAAITLCNHEFHEVCLKGWLSKKLTCPYCRKELPPLIEEEES